MSHIYRLGELLTGQEIITSNQLDEALIFQQQHHLPIGKALVKLGYANRQQIRLALFKQHWLRRIAAVTTLFIAPMAQCQTGTTNIEQLPEYSYTQVAQNPCPFQAIYSQFDTPTSNDDLSLIEATSAAIWYVSQGGIGAAGLADVPVQLNVTSKNLEDGIALNLSVRF